jgi:CheY-like chemotaxis protein
MSHILVAEDDPHILRVISLWLSRQGHQVLEARNGVIALGLFQQHTPEVLVTDVNMPAMDGLELVEQVLRQPGNLRGVIVLTNRWDHGQIREKQALSGVHVLPKPFSPSKLSDLIQSIVAREPMAVVGGSAPEPSAGPPVTPSGSVGGP